MTLADPVRTLRGGRGHRRVRRRGGTRRVVPRRVASPTGGWRCRRTGQLGERLEAAQQHKLERALCTTVEHQHLHVRPGGVGVEERGHHVGC